VPHITELCLFAAAFVMAFAYGPSLAGLVRRALRNTKRRWPRHPAALRHSNNERIAAR